jgi:hypothetical protein
MTSSDSKEPHVSTYLVCMADGTHLDPVDAYDVEVVEVDGGPVLLRFIDAEDTVELLVPVRNTTYVRRIDKPAAEG